MNRIKKITTSDALTYINSIGNIIVKYKHHNGNSIYIIKRVIGRNHFGIGFIKYEKYKKDWGISSR